MNSRNMEQRGLWIMITMTALAIVVTLAGTSLSALAQWDASLGERVTYEPSHKVQVISDIVYAQYSDRTLKLDLYLPRERPSKTIPGIIMIHGGGWLRGNKEKFAFITSRLAEEGFAAASIEYRLLKEAPFPAAIHDVKAATRWMRANAKKYGIAGEELGAIGVSAGAHLAVLLATSHGIPDLEGTGGHLSSSSEIQAAVGMAAPTNLIDSDGWHRAAIKQFLAVSLEEHPETWALASPISHVDRKDPPLLLLHSDSDPVVSIKQSIDLAERYEEVGATSELIKIPGAPHDFWIYQAWYGDTMEKVIAFFKAELVSSTIE